MDTDRRDAILNIAGRYAADQTSEALPDLLYSGVQIQTHDEDGEVAQSLLDELTEDVDYEDDNDPFDTFFVGLLAGLTGRTTEEVEHFLDRTAR